MKQFRPTVLISFASLVTVLVLFGAQLKVQTAFARPSYTSSSSSSPATNTCTGCHSGTAAAGGGVVVTFPSGLTYTPGVPQKLTVTLTDPTHTVYSYLLTARLATSVSTQAGSFTALDANSTVSGQDIEAASFSSPTWSFDWTPPSTSAGNVTFYLIGLAAGSPGGSTSGNGIYQSTFTLTPAAAATPDFSLSASPSSLTLTQGASGSSTVTVTPTNGFTGSIALSASGLPSGVSFSPTSITGTTTLALTATSSAATGTFPVTLTGTSGSLSHTATFSLVVNAAAVPNFSLSASPYTLTQGANGTSTITVTPQNGFTGSVTLSASGLPSGVTVSSFNPASTGTISVLTLAASSTAATGTFAVTITGTSGSLTHTATLSLTVIAATVLKPDFSLSASPSSLTLTQGSSGSSTITITPSGGFNSSSVSFSPPGLPSGLTASFSPISSTGTSTLTLSASSSAASLTVGLTITGTSGSLAHSTTVTLTVNAAAGTGTGILTASPASLTFNYQMGGRMPSSRTLAITSTGGSTSYTASETDPWLSITPTSGGGTPANIQASVNPTGMAPGTYGAQININAPNRTSATVLVTLIITSGSGGGGAGGGGTSGGMFAQTYMYDPTQSGGLAAAWVDNLGTTPHNTNDPRNQGLVLAKNATAPTGSLTGAVITNIQGSLTELGFDYRDGGQCTATSPRFVVVTATSGTHVVGGCSKGTITAAPTTGWKRVRFKLTDSSVQTSPVILPGDSVSSITLVLDLGPEAGPNAAGGLVVIDNIDVNGTIVGKGVSTTTSRDN